MVTEAAGSKGNGTYFFKANMELKSLLLSINMNMQRI